MKKIYTLIFAFLVVFIGNNKAQNGVDVSYSPFNSTLFLDEDDYESEKLFGGNQLSFRVGYFEWISETEMFNFSLQVKSKSADFYTVIQDFSSFPSTRIKKNYSFNSTSYILGYEGLDFYNEIDYKSQVYFRKGYLIGIRNYTITEQSSEIIPANSQYEESLDFSGLDSETKKSDFIFAINYGLGYQYNFTKKVGLYVEGNVSFDVPSISFLYNANVGLRYRIK